MIHFSEGSRKVESIDVPSFPLKYDSIKPETNINEKEAHDFWDEMFSEPTEVHQITEADIQRDVYGRSEEDFQFDFDVYATEIQDALEKFKSPVWESLSVEEQEEACRNLELRIADKLGIDNTPALDFYEADPYDCGAYDPDKNCIRINKNNFDDPQEIVDTVAHETRHAYQYQRAMNPELYIDLLYAYNFTHYISPYVDEDGYLNFIDYQDQLIEAEARAFANLFELEDGRNE